MLLNRYILSNLLKNVYLVYGSFIGLMFILQGIRILKFIPASAIEISHILSLGSVLIPKSLFVTHGIVSIIACYNTYHGMIVSSELTAMRSCGTSDKAIIKPPMIFAIIQAVIFAMVAFFLVPYCAKKMDKDVRTIKDQYILSSLKAGEVVQFKDTSVYYKEMDDDKMKDFIIIKMNEKDGLKSETIYAKHAYIQKIEDENFFVLENYQISEIYRMVNQDIKTQSASGNIARIKTSELINKNEDKKNIEKVAQFSPRKFFAAYITGNHDAIRILHKNFATVIYTPFAILCLLMCLMQIKTNRSKNTKYVATGINLASILSIASLTLPEILLKQHSIYSISIIYLFPVLFAALTNLLIKKL